MTTNPATDVRQTIENAIEAQANRAQVLQEWFEAYGHDEINCRHILDILASAGLCLAPDPGGLATLAFQWRVIFPHKSVHEFMVDATKNYNLFPTERPSDAELVAYDEFLKAVS